MDDFSFVRRMDDDDAYLFKRCIRKMLDSTFIVAEKDEKLYDFIASESNQYNVNQYLSVIGYQVVVEDRMKVAMLQQADEDIETVGLKRLNLYHFDNNQMRLLMILWLLFLERMGYADPVNITVGDIIDKCKIYQITMKPTDFKESYRIFKKFSLIDYSNDISTEDGKVRLYPSLQFCMNIEQLKIVMAAYTDQSEKDTTDMDDLLESEDSDE